MKTLLILSTTVLTWAGAAAADMTAPAQVTPVLNWSGFYVGGQGGGGWVNADRQDGDPNAVGLNLSGVIGGLYAGYNWQFPGSNFVVGVDTDIVFSGIDGQGRNLFSDSASAKWEWYGATRGRIGYAFDRFLPYVAGGVAYGRVKASYAYPDGSTFSGGKTGTGWTIGGGLDYAFTDNLVGRAEYRYTDFGTQHVTLTGGGVSGVSDIDLPVHDIRVGLSYKF